MTQQINSGHLITGKTCEWPMDYDDETREFTVCGQLATSEVKLPGSMWLCDFHLAVYLRSLDRDVDHE